MTLRCPECHMLFNSVSLLHTHRLKFCVGEGSRSRQRDRHSPNQDEHPHSPGDNTTKIAELQDRKDQQALERRKEYENEQQSPENTPDANVQTDNSNSPHENTDEKAGAEPSEKAEYDQKEPITKDESDLVPPTDGSEEEEFIRPGSQNTWDSRSRDLRDLHRQLRGQPQGVLSPAHSGALSATSTLSSMSIHLPSSSDEEDAPMTAERENRQRHLRMQAEMHGRNLAQYKSRSKALAMQKNEIERRLRELEADPIPVTNTQAIQDHDARNQQALNQLKKQVRDLSMGRPISSNSSLIGEIKNLRQLYLRQGGNHRGILAQMADLEAEASKLEVNPNTQNPRKERVKYDSMNEQLVAFEVENRRLQQELLETQDWNNRMLASKANNMADDGEADRLRRQQGRYKERLNDMEDEIELLKRQIKLSSLKKEVVVEREQAPVPQRPPVVYESSAEVPALLQPPPGLMVDMDMIPNGPYDKHSGFMVFYDFVTGLEMSVQAVRLVVSLYNNVAQYGQPSVLPTAYCDGGMTGFDTQRGAVYNSAFVSARQPVPRCPPAADLGLVIELQVASPGGRLSTRGWCRLGLFDSEANLVCGRWHIPIKILPIRPSASMSELYSIPQYGAAELYLRVVNFRDSDAQSVAPVHIQHAPRYHDPPQNGYSRYGSSISTMSLPSGLSIKAHSRPNQFVPPPPSATPPDSPDSYPQRSHRPDHRYDYEDQNSYTIGFQIDRVKNADPGEGKVRITAYHKSSGNVVQSDTSPVTASTTAVKSNFRHKHHVFGQQEALFDNVDVTSDVLLIVRFYLRRKIEHGYDDIVAGPKHNLAEHDDETLVAWTTMPLMGPKRNKGLTPADLTEYRVRTGTHKLPLYHPPIPEPESIPLDSPKQWERYNRASVRFHVFMTKPRPGSMTPSEDSDPEEEGCPEYAWISYLKPDFPSESYDATDGIDIYIDGCRNLPDAVTFTRVAGRILNRSYEKVGKDLNTSIKLDSDIYNPVYDFRTELREPNLPPTATILLKIYTIDQFKKEMMVVGYATLNLFVETGSNRQPNADTPGIQISLNEGAHQLRLYQRGPNGVDPLTSKLLYNAGTRHVPCATILIRLIKASIGPQGKPLEADKVPQTDWVRLGLFQARPSYDERVYQSLSCKPTRGECKLFQSLVKRPKITIRESLHMLLQPTELRKIRTDKDIDQYIRNKLTRLMDVVPNDIDLTFIAKYNPKLGIKFSLDSAMNLPWSSYTHAHYCLNPPGAFYQGQPFAAYDKLSFTGRLDPDSTNKSPSWKDGFRAFPNRTHHPHMTMVIHLQEVQVTVTADSYKYGLLDQAWTAIPVFSEGYAHTSIYQAPLFLGSPSIYALKQLTQHPAKEWLSKGVTGGNLKLIPGASVVVRVADARRDDELPNSVLNNVQVEINTDLLPRDQLVDYSTEEAGRVLSRMVPQGRSPKEFFQGLSNKFKSLVYKLYEEGNVNAK